MKTTPRMDPAAAFPAAQPPPSEAALKAALGPAARTLETVLAPFRAAHPDVTVAWRFSAQSGWYQFLLRRKRRLLYLIPKQGDFRLMMILGGKALADLQHGPCARQTTALLKTAKRYPEGTAFTFEAGTFDPAVVTAFLAAKLAH